MRRTNRISAALFIAALLLAGVAPAVSAEAQVSPVDWFGTLGQSVTSWWTALTRDGGSQRNVSAASEVSPSTDPTGEETSSSLDPTGAELSSTDTENDVSPHLDPNG